MSSPTAHEPVDPTVDIDLRPERPVGSVPMNAALLPASLRLSPNTSKTGAACKMLDINNPAIHPMALNMAAAAFPVEVVRSVVPILQVSALGKQVPLADGQLMILADISFKVAAGESVAIVGASGSGKSTLLGLMAGLDLPSSGSVSLQGENLQALSEDGRARLRARAVGFVFQSFQLLPALVGMLRAKASSRKVRVVLSSATLTGSTIHDLQHLFGPPERTYVVSAVHLRPEVRYAFRRCETTGERSARVLEAIRLAPRPFILYVTRPDEAEHWLCSLREAGVRRGELLVEEAGVRAQLRGVEVQMLGRRAEIQIRKQTAPVIAEFLRP